MIQALRRAGLTERAVFACFGVSCAAHVPRAIAAGRRFDTRPPPAAIAPWLFAGGGEVDAAHAARTLPVSELLEAGLLVRDGANLRAPRRILPAGANLAVCDDTFTPDDSSHHLVSALPRRRVARWLDLATGNAWAPLSWTRADHVIAADLSIRAIELARAGALLSERPIDLVIADLAEGLTGRFDLVTANLPIPDDGGALIARFWQTALEKVAPHGEVVVHSARVAPPDLPGDLQIAQYTPPGVAPFAVTVWRPDAPARRRAVEITLTADRPHVPRDVFEE